MASTLDELRAALDAATTDRERLAATLRLADHLLDDDPTEALELAIGAVEVAERLQDEQSIAEALRYAGLVTMDSNEYQRSLSYFERARGIYRQRGEMARVALTTGNIGRVHYNIGEHSRSLEEFQSALWLVVELDDRRSSGYYTGCIGEVYSRLGDHIKALEQLQTALSIATELDDRDHIDNWMGRLGDVYRDLGDLTRSLECYQSALALAERVGKRLAVACWTAGIGNVYYDLDDYDRSIEYYLLAREIFEEIGSRLNLPNLYQSIGTNYLERHDFDEALRYYRSARAAAEELGDRNVHADATGSIGIAYLELGDGDSAVEYLQRALSLEESLGARHHRTAFWTGKLGRAYALQSFDGYDPVRAESLLLQAIRLSEESHDRVILYQCHSWITALYRQEGRWQEAHDHLAKHYELKEEIQSQDAHRKAQQLEHQRQLAELEKQHVVERAEAELRAQQLRSEREIERMKAEQIEREVANTTLQLLAQTELLRELRNDLLKLARKIPPTEPVARELRERVKRLPCDAVDWKKFDAQFQAAHPEFVRALTERAPDLTVTEVRICTMVRMNLKSHEIAGLFCITEQGVEFHRKNIRRKLKLGKEEKLPIVLGVM